MNQSKGRHALLPQTLEAYEIGTWLKSNSVEEFTDELKRYFDEDEIGEFEHESSASGREINRLKSILKSVTEHVNKGGEEDLTIELPATIGVKDLENQRKQNDDLVERGYEVEENRIYGIVDEENATMEYFTVEGTHVKDRSRNLSAREKVEYLSPENVQSIYKAVNE